MTAQSYLPAVHQPPGAGYGSSRALLGVVTVTYNSVPVLEMFLRSVSAQTHRGFLLYAVDNASTDSTIEVLHAWDDPRLRVIANGENLGLAVGNNQGTRAALADGCDHVLYLNNDVEFEPDTFTLLLEELDGLGCDLLGPKILYEDRMRIWSAGGGFSSAKGHLGYHAGQGELDTGQFDTSRRIEHSPACCLLVRRHVFSVIGMIDPKYFVYQDDADFSYRARRAGLTMFYTPRARIFHKVSSLTGGPGSAFSMRYNTRGHIYFMLKNLGPLRCLCLLPAWELRLIYKLLSRTIGPAEFFVRQRAFFEGIGVWLS